MKRFINTGLIILLTATLAVSQEIDENKMQRDIEVAENILSTLMNRGETSKVKTLSYRLRSPFQGNYVKGYGVIFGAPGGLSNIYIVDGKRARNYSYSFGSTDNGRAVVIDTKEKVEKEYMDSLSQASQQAWVENAKTFLIDYAHLIGQLQPDEKIVITDGPTAIGDRQFFMRASPDNRTSVEATKKDIDAYHSGKLKKEQLLNLITVKESKETKVAKDVELMANILETLYKPDLSETYYISGGIYYENMVDLGVIFQMSFYSSMSERNGLHRIVTQNLEGLTQEERDEKVKAMYPQFLSDLKNNIVRYGRTIKSLKGNEQLIFNIKLTKCEGCDMPESLKLAIKGADLVAFDSGKISEKQAVDRIEVNEIGKQ